MISIVKLGEKKIYIQQLLNVHMNPEVERREDMVGTKIFAYS